MNGAVFSHPHILPRLVEGQIYFYFLVLWAQYVNQECGGTLFYSYKTWDLISVNTVSTTGSTATNCHYYSGVIKQFHNG